MKVYNKLVRDKIPAIIEADGRSCTTRVLDEREYVQELRVKLQEEVKEYLEAENVEELADVVEVLFALAKVHGAGEEELMAVRVKKREERGGFVGRTYLESIDWGHSR